VSYLISGTAANNTLRVMAADTTAIVETARVKHDSSATATAALGRTLTGSLLLAQILTKREQDRVTVRVQGDGPVGWIVCEGSKDGLTRGYVKHPEADLPARENDGKLDVSGLVGLAGDFAVTRLLENTEPYTGSVELVSAEIAEDMAKYLASSEQIPSAVMLGVHVNARGVTHAGGLLVQAMPGVTDATLSKLEANISAMGTFTNTLKLENGLLGVVNLALDGLGFEPNENALELRWQCRCSRDKALQSLTFFGDVERQDMIENGGQEVVCHWCNEKYLIQPSELSQLELQAQ
jgi:molecular chaperone Hsp33